MEKLSIKNALFDLMYLNTQLTQILEENPQYQELINIITEKDYMSDDNESSEPTITSISKKTGKKPHIIRRQIKEVHELLFSIDRAQIGFQKLEYWFCINSKEKFFQFRLKDLPVIPRVGEGFDIPFVLGIGIRDSLYVDRVDHTFENDKQVITIWLKPGIPNDYLKFRKDKAVALEELPQEELWKLDNYAVKQKIRRRELEP
ncbi:MAG: hypothetical protein ACQEWD_14320 [Bacteroidota bacterium]